MVTTRLKSRWWLVIVIIGTVHHRHQTAAHCTMKREFLFQVAVAAIVFLAQVFTFSTSITVLVRPAALVAHSKRWW